MYKALHAAMKQGLVASCHDVSDGGLGVALAESAFAGGVGAEVSITDLTFRGVDRDDYALFSESPCRFVVSVSEENRSSFEAALVGFALAHIGQVTDTKRLKIGGLTDNLIIDAYIWELKKAWQKPLGT